MVDSYVFGKTIVCKDVESAKMCAFSEGVRVRSVTLDGDLFDPAVRPPLSSCAY